MRVLVDFLPLLPRGGGLQNARNLWRTIQGHGREHHWLVFARPGLGLAPASSDHCDLREVAVESLGARLRIENVALPRAASAWGADVVWTPMGTGPLRSPVPRVIGWHDSSIAYPDAPVHSRLPRAERAAERLRAVLARVAGRRASRITVQTETMRSRLSGLWGLPGHRFHIVPNGPSTYLAREGPAPEHAPEPPVVLVVAEAKLAKNLEVLPSVAREMERRGRGDVRFDVTVSKGGDRWSHLLDDAMAREGEPEQINRIGRVAHEDLGPLFRGAAVVFLPSHFESFSATYVEAMHFGVPIVTSDRDFAHDVCGPAAIFADPLDPAACAEALERALDPAVRAGLRAAGFDRLLRFPDWAERFELYLAALAEAVGTDSPAYGPAGAIAT